MLSTTLRLLAIAVAVLFATLEVKPVIAQVSRETPTNGAKLKGGAFPEQAVNVALDTKSSKGTKETKTTTVTTETTKSSNDDDDDDDDDDTTASSNDRKADNCIDDEHPRPVRKDDDDKAQRYRFSLKHSDAHCVDEDDERYQYGEYDDVEEFSDCADLCVYEGEQDLLDSLVGFEWHCTHEKCRCLYEEGALGDQKSKDIEEQFDRVDEDYEGEGSVNQDDGKDKDGWYCAKLAQAEEVMDVAVQVGRRGLRA